MANKNISYYTYIIFAAIALGISRYSYSLGIFAFIGFIPLFRFFEQAKHKTLTLLKAGAIFSIINTLISYHWVGVVTIPGLIGMIILFGLYYWASFGMINYIWNKNPKLKLWGFIMTWMALESFTFLTEFRFPWLNIGYALVDFNYLLQIADIGGVYLLSFLVLLANVIIYQIMQGKKQFIYVMLILVTVWLGYGYVRSSNIKLTKEDIKVKVMQPCIPVDKFDMDLQDILNIYDKQAYYASLEDVDLHIWPEASMPISMLDPNYANVKEAVRAIAKRYKLNLFLGTIHHEKAPENYYFDQYNYNTAVMVSYPELTFSEPYFKRILVPVGERMPYLDYLPFLRNLEFGQANWEFGKEAKFYQVKTKQGKEFTYSPQICYEIIFPEISNEIARHDVDFIVNITNDAWFGNTVGTFQHAMMTRVRAIETRKPIIRCANNGHSMVVSPNGKIETYSKLNDLSNFDAPVFTTSSESIYVKYLYGIKYFFFAGLFIVFLLAKFLKV